MKQNHLCSSLIHSETFLVIINQVNKCDIMPLKNWDGKNTIFLYFVFFTGQSENG